MGDKQEHTLDEMDLLSIAQKELFEIVLPQLEGEARYHGLMIANALGIAQRMQGDNGEATTNDAQLCQDIRNGDYEVQSDAFKNLTRLLRQSVIGQLSISNPKHLNHLSRAKGQKPSEQ